jgi:hypothetical protein
MPVDCSVMEMSFAVTAGCISAGQLCQAAPARPEQQLACPRRIPGDLIQRRDRSDSRASIPADSRTSSRDIPMAIAVALAIDEEVELVSL